jgi:quercetin dioxygenase-like cupin family protein
MKFTHVLLSILGALAVAAGQSPSKAIVTNLETAKWTVEKGGLESVLVRTDAATGGMELLVRFPSGHVVPAHSHDSNEHIVVLEGQLALHQDTGDTIINTGGLAYLPAHEVQRMSCSSKSRCTFYLAWDGNPASHAAK